MGTISSSNKNQAHSQDLLSSLSEQNIQSIASFLDLSSLENLQRTNRRMRKLFEASLWNRLFIITFNPDRNENDGIHINGEQLMIENREEGENAMGRPQIYTHEMFRTQWFERYPQELLEFQNRMRNLRLEESQRQEALVRERRARIERKIKDREKTINSYIDLYVRSGFWERILLSGLIALIMVTLFAQGLEIYCYTCSGTCDYEKINYCNDSCSYYSLFDCVIVLIIACIWSWECAKLEDSSPRSQKDLARLCFRTILKLILFIAAAIYYFNVDNKLSSAGCDDGVSEFGTMTAIFPTKRFVIAAVTFIFVILLQIFNLYLEVYAIYACFNPIHPLNRPLLLDLV